MQTCFLDPEAVTDFSPANQRLLALVAAGRQMWTLKVHARACSRDKQHAACRESAHEHDEGLELMMARSQPTCCA